MAQRVGETWTEIQAPDFGLLALAGPPPCPLPVELGFWDGQGLPSPWVQSWRVDRKGYGGPPLHGCWTWERPMNKVCGVQGWGGEGRH